MRSWNRRPETCLILLLIFLPYLHRPSTFQGPYAYYTNSRSAASILGARSNRHRRILRFSSFVFHTTWFTFIFQSPFSLSLFPSLSFSLSFSLSLSRSRSLSVAGSVSLSTSLSRSLFHQCVFLLASLSLLIYLSMYLSFSLSLSFFLSQSLISVRSYLFWIPLYGLSFVISVSLSATKSLF